MSPSATALLIILAIVGVGSFIGFRAGASRRMDLEQWTVANRGFGVVLVWLLMAGEVYTTFSFLGASGWAYSRGGPTLYVGDRGLRDWKIASWADSRHASHES